MWCICVDHLTRSVSTCCFPLPLLFACLARCCNCSSFSLPLTGTSKRAVFWRISGGFAPFSCVFLFLSWTFPFQQIRRAKKKWRSSFFFLGFFGRNLWRFQVFSVSFFISFFLACLCSLGLSQSRSDRRGCQSCLAGFSSSLQDMKTLCYKKWKREAALSCLCGAQKRFWCLCVLPVESLQAARVLHSMGGEAWRIIRTFLNLPGVRSRGPVACLRTSIVGDERQEGLWQMANKMKRFL